MRKLQIVLILLSLYFVGVIYQIVLPDTVTRHPTAVAPQAMLQATPQALPQPATQPAPSLAVMKVEPAAVPPSKADSSLPPKKAEEVAGDYKSYPQAQPQAAPAAEGERQARAYGEEDGGGVSSSGRDADGYARPGAPSRQAMNAPLAGSIERQIEDYISEVHFKDKSQFLEQVDYFDRGVVPREVAERDIVRYMRRWPYRNFELTPGTLHVRSEGEGRYVASFLYSYEVARGRRVKSGTGASTLELVTIGGQFYVARIKEAVHRDPD